MAIPIIRVLIINKNLSALVSLKQALERTGEFEVASFTTPDAALDLLRTHACDIAIVEFGLPSMNGQELVSRIRALHPDMVILASPHMPNVMQMARQLDLDGVVDVPMPLRDLLPILKRVVYADMLPDTSQALLLDESDTMKMATNANRMDEVLTQMGNATLIDEGGNTIEVIFSGDMAELNENPQDDPLFQQLLAEEPPMPTLEEIGTVADLRDVVAQVDLGRVNTVLKEAMTPYMPLLPSSEITDQATENIPAQHILRATMDDSQSLHQSIGSVIEALAGDIQAPKLPFGLRQDLERYIKEPDFLSIMLDVESDVMSATTHAQHAEDLVQNLLDLPTEHYTKAPPPKPTTLPNTSPKAPDTAPSPPPAIVPVPPPPAPISAEESQTATLALILTQASLELSADAVLLSREGRVVANAGNLPAPEVQQLHQFVLDAEDEPLDGARIRFIRLPISGQDYMLYSRLAAGGYTLTMVFGGGIHLHVIRKQSDRLLNALKSVPEAPAASTSILEELQERELEQLEMAVADWEASLSDLSDAEVSSEHFTPLPITLEPLALPSVLEPVQGWHIPELSYPIYSGTPAPFTYVWSLADGMPKLSPKVRDIMGRELEGQLTEIGMSITTLVVHETYVYLLAKTPSDTPPSTVIQDLKTRSAWIAHHVDDAYPQQGMWAESYCVLAPGREMGRAEIDRFIQFSRAS